MSHVSQVISPAAVTPFSWAAKCTDPMFELLYQTKVFYDEGRYCRLVASGLCTLVASAVLAPFSVLFSTVGATLLTFYRKQYIHQVLNPNRPLPSYAAKTRAATWNSGLLPGGKLGREATVGKFAETFAEEKEQIANDIASLCKNHNVVVLQEMGDVTFVQEVLIPRLMELGKQLHVYWRISEDPLKPGIPSCLAMFSDRPLENIKVESLPSDLLFNRAMVSFKYGEDRYVLAHVKDPDSIIEYRDLLKRTLGKFSIPEGEGALLIGDYNTDEEALKELREKDRIEQLVQEPTMQKTIRKRGPWLRPSTELRPDLVAKWGGFTKNMVVKVLQGVISEAPLFHFLSDHLPVSVEIG